MYSTNEPGSVTNDIITRMKKYGKKMNNGGGMYGYVDSMYRTMISYATRDESVAEAGGRARAGVGRICSVSFGSRIRNSETIHK